MATSASTVKAPSIPAMPPTRTPESDWGKPRSVTERSGDPREMGSPAIVFALLVSLRVVRARLVTFGKIVRFLAS
jgi:hypothetical protein